MNWFHALLLGLIQGLTEFLPVSSSGHLVIGRNLLGITDGGLTFEIWVHLATLVSVVVALRSDLQSVLRSLIPGASFPQAQTGRRIALGVVLGTIPAVLVGLFLKDAVEAAFTSVRLVGIDLLVTAVILFISRYFKNGTSQMTPGRSIIIGLAQALAILPGISRSGATLTAGLITGLPGVDAARFSFMLAVPVILGAVVLDLPALASMGSTSPMALIVGFLSASLSGYLAIRLVWKVMERGRLAMFAPYCALVGLVVMLWGGTATP